jgi:hypothetical protein
LILHSSSGKRVPEAAASGPAGRILHGVPSGLESSGSHDRWLKPPALILFPFGEPGTPKGLCRKAGDFSHRKRIPTVPVVLKGRCQVHVCRMNLLHRCFSVLRIQKERDVISALLQKICHSVQSPCFRGTLFSTHALRGITNKKSGEYFKIRILKAPPRHLYPQSTGTVKSPRQSMGIKQNTPLWGVRHPSPFSL